MRGVRISYYTPPKFNKDSTLSPFDILTICLIGSTALNYVLVFSTSEYLISSSYCCPTILFFRCADPQQLISKHISSLFNTKENIYPFIASLANTGRGARKLDVQNFKRVFAYIP